MHRNTIQVACFSPADDENKSFPWQLGSSHHPCAFRFHCQRISTNKIEFSQDYSIIPSYRIIIIHWHAAATTGRALISRNGLFVSSQLDVSVRERERCRGQTGTQPARQHTDGSPRWWWDDYCCWSEYLRAWASLSMYGLHRRASSGSSSRSSRWGTCTGTCARISPTNQDETFVFGIEGKNSFPPSTTNAARWFSCMDGWIEYRNPLCVMGVEMKWNEARRRWLTRDCTKEEKKAEAES